MAARTMKRADTANRSGLPPGRLEAWDRHFKFYESRDILSADQGRSTNMREIIWHQADPRKVPAVATTWFTGRRNAA
jgi:hypothetical protein